MTPLSVVVAAAPGLGEPARCASALLAELEAGDEIVWVGGQPPTSALAVVVTGAAGGRGGLYRAGLDVASHELVAFTDTATLVLPGWRQAAGGALEGGAAAVGGPVLPEPGQAARSFAGFVAEYGAHAAPPFSSATGDVAANNVAYQRTALDDVLGPGAPVWKAVVDARLAAAGRPPVIHHSMRVVSTKCYRWSDLVSARARHGRLYGAQRAAHLGRFGRAAGVARCVALPLVAYGRLGARLAVRREFRRRFVLASPMVLVALIAWSAGEAAGLWTARGDPSDII